VCVDGAGSERAASKVCRAQLTLLKPQTLTHRHTLLRGSCARTQDKASGELKPTKKGITLAQSEWAALQGVLPALSQAVADGNDAFVAELANNVRATTSTYQ
jgi:hypothetical protein